MRQGCHTHIQDQFNLGNREPGAEPQEANHRSFPIPRHDLEPFEIQVESQSHSQLQRGSWNPQDEGIEIWRRLPHRFHRIGRTEGGFRFRRRS